MPYRIKARNRIGNTVTRVDMQPGATDHITRVTAELLAEQFAQSQKAAGPWQGFVEYYDSAESIKPPEFATRQEQILSKMTPKRRGVNA